MGTIFLISAPFEKSTKYGSMKFVETTVVDAHGTGIIVTFKNEQIDLNISNLEINYSYILKNVKVDFYLNQVKLQTSKFTKIELVKHLNLDIMEIKLNLSIPQVASFESFEEVFKLTETAVFKIQLYVEEILEKNEKYMTIMLKDKNQLKQDIRCYDKKLISAIDKIIFQHYFECKIRFKMNGIYRNFILIEINQIELSSVTSKTTIESQLKITQPPTSERSLTNVTSFESHLPVGLHELTNLQQHTTSETTKSENDLEITTDQQQQSSLKRSAISYIIDEVKK